jgi:hypothetical protein
MDAEQIRSRLPAFKAEFDKITRARSPLEIRHFIVGYHENRWKQWYQLCIECDAKWRALEEAEAGVRLTELDIRELNYKIEEILEKIACRGNTSKTREDLLDEIAIERLKIQVQQKKNGLAHAERLMTGALKEIADYLALAESEYKDFWGKSEEQLVAENEKQYWNQRLARQIAVDILTFGRAQAGNINVLLQLGENQREEIQRSALAIADSYIAQASKIEKSYMLEASQKAVLPASSDKRGTH